MSRFRVFLRFLLFFVVAGVKNFFRKIILEKVIFVHIKFSRSVFSAKNSFEQSQFLLTDFIIRLFVSPHDNTAICSKENSLKRIHRHAWNIGLRSSFLEMKRDFSSEEIFRRLKIIPQFESGLRRCRIKNQKNEKR